MELDCTYRYYLEPIYKLREVLGAESFESLTTQIQTANELLQDKKQGGSHMTFIKNYNWIRSAQNPISQA